MIPSSVLQAGYWPCPPEPYVQWQILLLMSDGQLPDPDYGIPTSGLSLALREAPAHPDALWKRGARVRPAPHPGPGVKARLAADPARHFFAEMHGAHPPPPISLHPHRRAPPRYVFLSRPGR